MNLDSLKNYNPSLKTDTWELLQIANILGIDERSYKLLLEAYRRKNLTLMREKNVYGVGTPSKYKDKFFTAINKNNVKSHLNTNWTLSTKGKEVLQILESYIKIPQHKEVKTHLNKVILNMQSFT